MDYITKKVPRHLSAKIRRLKALLSLKGTRKVTEGDVLSLALSKLESSMETERRYTLMELAGSIKFRKPVRPKDIDELVYGV
jgi:hypothetical protein